MSHQSQILGFHWIFVIVDSLCNTSFVIGYCLEEISPSSVCILAK
uniref:Uncharacterized protein n=1 Tax=Rhizophora mucronata TaxID=61149 RepID=A0A2P2QQW8_RHIMU